MTQRPPNSPWLLAIAGGVAFAYLADLAILAITHRWIVDAGGHPLAADFLSFWSAGRFALGGHAVEAYDWSQMHAFQQALMSHRMDGFLGWAYPPLFFVVAMPLAALPYGMAFLVWIAISGAIYLAATALVAKTGRGALFASAAPASLACLVAGQNGFLTAALMASVLLQLETRPLLAGLVLALLTYKPHFGLLFPVALLFGGYSYAFAAAVFGTLAIMLLSWTFAPASLDAFAGHLGGMSQDFLSHGHAGFYKMQSLYGLLRMFEMPDGWAFAAQGLLLAIMAVFVAALWRSDKPFSLKCAGLVTASLLATPYLYLYDFPILAIAMAFLWQAQNFDRAEWCLLIISQLVIAAFLVVKAPLGFAAAMLVLALVIRRLSRQARTGSPARRAERLAPAIHAA